MTIRSITVYVVDCDAKAAADHASRKMSAKSMADVNLRLRMSGWQVSPGGETHRCPLHHKK